MSPVSQNKLFQYQVLTEQGSTLIQLIGPDADQLARAVEASLAQPNQGVQASFRLDTLPSSL